MYSMAQTVKCLPAMWATRVRSLAREDPLKKEMATDSSTLAWKIPWTEEPGGLQSMGITKSRTRLSSFTFHFTFIAVVQGRICQQDQGFQACSPLIWLQVVPLASASALP